MQPWDESGFHEENGCPSYGDPRQGYDREGYEKSKRGLHRDTGYNRVGVDRLGRHRLGDAVEIERLEDRVDAHAEARWGDCDYEYYDGGRQGLQEEDAYPAANNDEEGHRLHAAFMDNLHPYECRCAECTALVQRLRNLFRQEETVEVEEDHPLGLAGGAMGETADVTLEADQVYPVNGEANAGRERVGQADLDDEEFAEVVEHTRRQMLFDNDDLIDSGAPAVAIAAVAPQNVLSLAAAWSRRHWDHINVAEIRLEEPGSQQRQRPSPPSDAIRRELRLRRRVPLLGPNPYPGTGLVDFEVPTFRQIDCDHSWRREYLCYTQFSFVMCPGCCYNAEDWVKCCATCGMVACDSCSNGFTDGSLRWLDEIANLVGVILWAESGAVPYKLERLRSRELPCVDLWGGCDASALGLATMMDFWEQRYFKCHPFMYGDFGTKLMFEEAESDMRREYWPIAEENVGFLGFTMTFDLASNPYAPLMWDDEL